MVPHCRGGSHAPATRVIQALGRWSPVKPHSDGWLYLVRHGRTKLNVADQLRGHLDPPLDDTGLREASQLAETLATVHPVRIITSPLQRALHTARILATHAQAPVVIDDRLIDRDYGPLSGKSRAAALTEHPSFDAISGVEPSCSVVRRVHACLEDHGPFLRTHDPIIIVAHDAINCCLLADLDPTLGTPEKISQRTACWNLLRRTSRGWVVYAVDHKADSIVQ